MQKNWLSRIPASAFLGVSVYIAIFVLGFQYSYYLIFSLPPGMGVDDEGTFLLQVRAFSLDTRSYDLNDLFYGPFYYISKYAIYSILNTDVSHDINRLSTIIFWGLIAAVSAFFVHRLTRSLILSSVVQIWLIFYLAALLGSTGHPQETALLLIVSALFLSSYVGSQRYGFLSRIGLGVTLGALLLVKINVGVYVGMALALSMLFLLPQYTFVRCLLWFTSVIAVLVPTAIMWRHIQLLAPDRNYCILVTLVIAACLITASRKADDTRLQWSDVGITVSAMFLSMACIVGIIVLLGGSVSALVDFVILRPLKLSSVFHMTLNIPDMVIYASIGSVLLALCYRFVILKIGNNESTVLALSLLKLLYGCFVLYMFNAVNSTFYSHLILIDIFAAAVPFMWLVLIEPYGYSKSALGDRFPRVFLCLLTAFQTLQAYPVAGVQASWSVFLLIPLAMICIGDSLPILCAHIKRRWPEKVSGFFLPWHYSIFVLLVLCVVSLWYYQKANFGALEKRYAQQEPLDLPGASRVRLPKQDALAIRGLVESIRSHCDGFVGLPGMPSLYFLTQISPPGLITDCWMLDLDYDRQREIMGDMERYERPCVVYNRRKAEIYTDMWRIDVDNPQDPKRPLVEYTLSKFTEVRKYGDYSLLMKNEHVSPAL